MHIEPILITLVSGVASAHGPYARSDDDGVFIKYVEEERRSRRPVAAATRRDAAICGASLCRSSSTYLEYAFSSLLALLASRGVAATTVIRIGSCRGACVGAHSETRFHYRLFPGVVNQWLAKCT